MKFKDLSGQRFSRLVVIERAKSVASGTAWKCRCDCGNIVCVSASNLRHTTHSCGCLRNELTRAKFRKEAGRSGQTYLYGAYRGSAKKRKIRFDLTKEEFLEITKLDCQYCGRPPSSVTYNHLGTEKNLETIAHSSYVYNGVDRVDNTKGYEQGNVVPCCTVCNRAKSTMTVTEFLDWIKRVYHHNESKQC